LNSTELDPVKAPAAAGITDQWARAAVHALLRRLVHGNLLLEEGGQVYSFGEDRQHATLCASLQVRDTNAYLALLRNGSVGAGEAYMQGWWDSPDLVQVVRVFVRNMEALNALEAQGAWWQRLGMRALHAWRGNSRSGARRNIAAHYDLGNDFFSLFLDRTMAYSAGLYRHGATTLEQASLEKFRHICARLQLQPQDHLLEIGSGWGGLAIYAAQTCGCRVTTTTLSHEQYLYARDWVRREGLEHRVTVLERDYRDLEGQYDKLVSVEMIEAVGARYYASWFAQCSRLLKPTGLMLIQAITISDQRYEASLTNTDFIKRYIFPGGQLPSNAVVARHVASDTDMQMIALEDITHDYALTLHAWHERFQHQLADVRRLGYDEVFIRMWRYYFCFCEGGFRERVIHTAQFLLAKPGYRQQDAVRVSRGG
jgi:cyclopropane-fatty-acyl-phospholipid synthase